MTDLNQMLDDATKAAENLHSRTGRWAVSARTLTYSALGSVLGFAIEALKPENAAETVKLLNSRGVKPAKPGDNPVLPLIYATDGYDIANKTMKFQGAEITKWVQRKSLTKYAGVLRLALEEGITSSNLESWLETFGETHKKPNGDAFPNRLQGAAQAAAAKWSVPRKSVKASVLDAIAGLQPQTSTPSPTDAPAERRFFLVLAFDDGKGQRHFLDVVSDSERAAQNYGKTLVAEKEV